MYRIRTILLTRAASYPFPPPLSMIKRGIASSPASPFLNKPKNKASEAFLTNKQYVLRRKVNRNPESIISVEGSDRHQLGNKRLI